ncbi:MAG: hypothetical protein IJ400_06810 [Clostridia bacterium]|nr:hypothetical protein [Clostridia bacterium]
MKKYILPEDVNWYRANMHCHSTVSDGSLTPEEIKKEYKAQGYSIVAYTDHEILLDHSDLDDEDFLTLTSSEYSITETQASVPSATGSKGNNPWSRKKTVHMCIYSKDQHNVFQPAADDDSFRWVQGGIHVGRNKCDGYKRVYTKESINETIKRCNEAGFFVQFNHPNWSLNDRTDYLGLEGLWSLEILNYATERLTGSEYCPYIYDDMFRSGMHNLYCSMGDDNHNRGRSLVASFGGSTFFGAKELKYDQIVESMEKGNFYCASGKNPPRIKALYVEDNILKIDCTEATDVILTGYARNWRNISGEGITHAEFPLKLDDVYFRITVRDMYGNNAHTHYYRVKDFYEEVQE